MRVGLTTPRFTMAIGGGHIGYLNVPTARGARPSSDASNTDQMNRCPGSSAQRRVPNHRGPGDPQETLFGGI